MHIVMVASPWLGGSGTVGYRLARALGERNHSVSFVSYDSPFLASKTENGVTYTDVHPYEYPLFPFPLYELSLADTIVESVRKHNASIIHCHYGILFGHAGLIAREICRSEGRDVKLVITAHGSDVLGFDLSKPGTVVPKHLNMWIFNAADVVTAVSEDLRSSIQTLYNVKREILVIPNSIEVSKFDAERDSWNGGRIRFLHVSNFRAVKRPMIALEIIRTLHARGVDADLTFIGEGPEKSRTMERARMDKLDAFVRFAGSMSEEQVRDELFKAHALLLTSQYESFSLAALEAHAAGLPVISAHVGGVAEVVSSGKSGELVSAHDRAVGYADAAARIFSSPETWASYSLSARERAEQFDDNNIVPRYESLYQKLAQKN